MPSFLLGAVQRVIEPDQLFALFGEPGADDLRVETEKDPSFTIYAEPVGAENGLSPSHVLGRTVLASPALSPTSWLPGMTRTGADHCVKDSLTYSKNPAC